MSQIDRLLMLAGALAATHFVSPTQAPEPSAVELEIIAVAIDSLYVKEGVTPVVIESPTAMLFSRSFVSVVIVGVPESNEIAADMNRRNAVSGDLRGLARVLPSHIRLSFVSRDSLRRFLRGNPDEYWRGFYAAFPGSDGLITVSRPGISADGSTAVLMIGKGCGGRCGAWGDALLRKIGGRWQIVRFVITSMS